MHGSRRHVAIAAAAQQQASAPGCSRATGRRSVRSNRSSIVLKSRDRLRGAHLVPTTAAWRRRPPSWARARPRSHRSRRVHEAVDVPGTSCSGCRTADRRRAGTARTDSTARVSARAGDGWQPAAWPEALRPCIAKTDAHSLPTASSTATSPSVHDCIAVDVVIGTAIGASAAEEVGQDQAAERRQPAELARDGRARPTSGRSESLRAGTKSRSGPVAEDLIRDVGVAIARVARFGDAGHAMSMQLNCGSHTMPDVLY